MPAKHKENPRVNKLEVLHLQWVVLRFSTLSESGGGEEADKQIFVADRTRDAYVYWEMSQNKIKMGTKQDWKQIFF